MQKLKTLCTAALILLAGLCLCACAPKTTQTASAPVTLDAFQFELDNQAIDFANLWFYDALEEKTGVHINFEEVKEADWTTRLNLMFASGDLADVVLRGTVDVEEFGVAQGLLIPLEDLLPEYMPIYWERLQNSGLPENRASDGHIYYVGFLISQDVNTNGHWFINRDWLNQLGLEIPTTVDELTDTLRAFKAAGLGGAPYQATFNDENNGVYNAFQFFGIPLNYESYLFIAPDDTVRLAPLAPGFRECAEWLHTLYREGLLDPECITQNSNLWSAKLNRESGGLMTYWRLSNTALSPEIASQFTLMLPVAAEGYAPQVSATLERIEFGAALTTANRHIEETLRWLDAQFETETMMISQNGEIGETLEMGEDGRYRVKYVPPDNELYKRVPVICGQFFAPPAYYRSVYEMAPHRAEKAAYCRTYAEAGVMEYKSFQYLTDIAVMPADQNTRATRIYNEIDKHVTEALTGFITQGVTDASWQQFIDAFDGLGAAEYVRLYQEAYDGYLDKANEAAP